MKNIISVCISILLSVLILCAVGGCQENQDSQVKTTQKDQQKTAKKVQKSQRKTTKKAELITVKKAQQKTTQKAEQNTTKTADEQESKTKASKQKEEPTLSTTKKTDSKYGKKPNRSDFKEGFTHPNWTFDFSHKGTYNRGTHNKGTYNKDFNNSDKRPGMFMSEEAVDKFYKAIKAIDFKSEQVSAIVNDEIIYKYQVLEAKAISEFSFNHNSFVFRSDEKGKQENTKNNSKTEEEILEELIENTVIVQKAKETGISAMSKDNLDKQVESYIKFMKMDDNYYTKTLEAYNMTEEEYKKKISAQYETTYYTTQYRFKFFENTENRFSKENMDKYQKHVEELIKQADVQYK